MTVNPQPAVDPAMRTALLAGFREIDSVSVSPAGRPYKVIVPAVRAPPFLIDSS